MTITDKVCARCITLMIYILESVLFTFKHSLLNRIVWKVLTGFSSFYYLPPIKSLTFAKVLANACVNGSHRDLPMESITCSTSRLKDSRLYSRDTPVFNVLYIHTYIEHKRNELYRLLQQLVAFVGFLMPAI